MEKTYIDNSAIDHGLRDHMSKTYALVASGLVVSAATAWIISATALRNLFYNNMGELTILGHIGMWAPLLLLLAAAAMRTSGGISVRGLYWGFVALLGIGLSLTVSFVAAGAIVRALAITACTFGSLSLYGYTTKTNLSGWGNFLLIGLFGVIIASIANLFLASSALDFAISVCGVLIFAGFTAYDTQNIKNAYFEGLDSGQLEDARYNAAIGLYLDIVNLFQFFLNLGRN